MDMLDQLITELRTLFKYDYKARESLREATYPEEVDLNNEHLSVYERRIRSKLTRFLQYPPYHIRHLDKIAEFDKFGKCEESVFIMTKFCEGESKLDKELQRVIDVVSQSIEACGLRPRIASDRDFHEHLWDNVELHLLCCNRGIAIIEDHYMPELNPNIAMEWGWMKAMKKDVLYLVEKDFTHFRADWLGLIKYSFAWDHPETDIPQAIKKWVG